MSGFFTMGGYGTYVWPAYALFLFVLLGDFLAPVVRRDRLLRELRRRIARQDARKQDAASRVP